MTDTSKPEDFIIHYTKMLPDSDSSELQKVLEMRGMRRAEQTQLIQLFRSRVEGVPSTGLSTYKGNNNIAGSTMPAALSAVVSMAADGIGDSSMKRLEKLVKKRF